MVALGDLSIVYPRTVRAGEVAYCRALLALQHILSVAGFINRPMTRGFMRQTP